MTKTGSCRIFAQQHQKCDITADTGASHIMFWVKTYVLRPYWSIYDIFIAIHVMIGWIDHTPSGCTWVPALWAKHIRKTSCPWGPCCLEPGPWDTLGLEPEAWSLEGPVGDLRISSGWHSWSHILFVMCVQLLARGSVHTDIVPSMIGLLLSCQGKPPFAYESNSRSHLTHFVSYNTTILIYTTYNTCSKLCWVNMLSSWV